MTHHYCFEIVVSDPVSPHKKQFFVIPITFAEVPTT